MSTPMTPAAMFDRLHRWFGIGSGHRAWQHERAVEIGKLKAMLKSRRATLTEVNIAAEYAREHKKNIHSTWQVFALIPEAMREHWRAKAERDAQSKADEFNQAVQDALDSGEIEWAQRLLRASDVDAAVAEWRTR